MMDYTTGTLEISELQAVDFALGAYIASVFAGQRKDSGTKEWREFLSRPVKQQIYRGDHDDPGDFIKALQSSTGQPANFPLVYYFRKAGFTNADHNRGMHRHAMLSASKSFDLVALPISLDYRFYLLAWDKPTLDKLGLVWYAYVNAKSAKFPVKYMMDGDVFDVPAYIADNRTVTLSDCTGQSSNPGARRPFYGVMTAMTVNTQILQGAAVPAPPEIITIEIKPTNYRKERHSIAVGDSQATSFTFDTTARFGKTTSFMPQYVEIYAGRSYIGSDDGNGHLTGTVTVDGTTYTLTGTVDYDAGVAHPTIIPAPPTGVELSIKISTKQGLVAAGCPDCHNYRG